MMGADDGEPGVDPGPAAKRLTAAEVAKAVDAYLAQNYNNPDLEVVELMEFEKNFYAQVAEKSTEINAFELLIDPYTGVVWPEYGPNMMWNTKYGHMSGMGGMMMQGWGGKGIGEPTADMPVNLDQARKNAQAYLDARKSGLTIEDGYGRLLRLLHRAHAGQGRQHRRHVERQRLHRPGLVSHLAREVRRHGGRHVVRTSRIWWTQQSGLCDKTFAL